MGNKLKILFVEDEEQSTMMLVRLLRKEGIDPDYIRVDNGPDMRKALEEKEWDIVISDYSMPAFSGEEALKIFNAAHPDIPFILLSGSVGESIAVQMLKSGASDYIMKDKLSMIVPSINRELAEFANRRKNKAMEAAWLDSEERFRTAFENTPIGMDLISLDGTILQVNKAFCEMLGYTQPEMLQRNFRSLTHPEDVAMSDAAMQRLLSGEADTVRFEKRYNRKDGSFVWVNLSSSMVKNPQGKPQYLIVQAEDITNKKLMVDLILQAKEKAEESDRLKSALLTNMSHEFRTPMNGILGFAELITKSSAPNDVKNMGQLISMSGKRLMQVLESIMLLAQLQSGTRKVDIAISHVSLSQLLTQIAKTYEPMINEKGLFLNLQIEEGVFCESEPKLLRQIVSKLIDNALKFTHSGSILLSLHTEVQGNQKVAGITVQDTGIGIKEDYLDSIFDEFRQASEGYDRSYEGIGIGLTIVKKIVELFQGTIRVTSAVGEGSTFTIYLPLGELVSTGTDLSFDGTEITEGVPDHHSISRILIVEDNMINTKLMVHFISDYCQMIDCASTGESAVDMARTNTYDMILMDINLGAGIDGLQATQLIRKFPGYEKLPIVAVTGYTMLGDKERLLEGGCSHYVGKPFTQETISELFKEILTNRSQSIS